MKNNHSSEKIRRTFLRAMLLLTMLCTGTSCDTDDTENGSRQLLEITKRGWVKLDKTLSVSYTHLTLPTTPYV